MKSWSQRIAIVAGIIGLSLLIPLLLRGGEVRVSAQNQQTATVQRTVLASRVETTGSIAPASTVYLSFGTNGIVKDVMVEVGDIVKMGDVLATLDTTDLENQIAVQEQNVLIKQASYDQLVADPTDEEISQAQATLASAQSQQSQANNNRMLAANNSTINCSSVESASRELNVAQKAYEDYIHEGYTMDAGFIPDEEADVSEALADAQNTYAVAEAQCSDTAPMSQYDIAVTAADANVAQAQAALDALLNGPTAEDVASAKAQLQQAQLQLDDARTALNDAQIIATQAGVVSAVEIVKGQFVTSGATAVALVDDSQLHIDVTVDELDIVQIKEGQTVEITTDALDGITLEGTVSRIAPTADNTDGVVTYNVRVDLTDAESQPIRIGMTTDVAILVSDATEVLVVPTEAVQRNGTQEFVTVQNPDGTTVQVTVTTGSTNEGMTEVKGDLTAGTTVLIPTAAAQSGGMPGAFGG
jgi:HlyD family secretion protein